MGGETKRSLAQNRLYWKWMGEIADQANTTDGQALNKDEWHFLCALRFLGYKDLTVMKQNYKIPSTSTSKLGVGAFADYLTEIEAEFTTRGVKLSFPEDYNLAMGKQEKRHG